MAHQIDRNLQKLDRVSPRAQSRTANVDPSGAADLAQLAKTCSAPESDGSANIGSSRSNCRGYGDYGVPVGRISYARDVDMGTQVESLAPNGSKGFGFEDVIDDIRDLNWASLTQEDLINVAWVYYYFSV